MKKVLFFFPHNPFPPRSGAHKRCLELLDGLKSLGCAITFASSTFTSEEPWTETSIAGLTKEFGCTVMLHRPGMLERKAARFMGRYLSRPASLDTMVTSGMRRWFGTIAAQQCPDVIFMNYVYFDSLISGTVREGRTTIMEMHDLVTLNTRMQDAIRKSTGMESLAGGGLPDETLTPDFFQKKKLSADPVEFEIYNRYDYTLCISSAEQELVQANAPGTLAVYLPMTHPVFCHENSRDGSALFTVGPNLFNVQGYYFFREKVLPLVLERQPDFRLTMTGGFNHALRPQLADGIDYQGFVPDLGELYRTARFFLCPVFGGTGQQVKIVEAMAHGLPVVALEDAARRSPLRHGENGLVARDADEFAEHVVRLWNDWELCCRLGNAARLAIAAEYGRDRLLAGLGSAVGL